MLCDAPAPARRPRCNPPEVTRLRAIIANEATGDLTLVLATIQRRMSMPQLECWASQSMDKQLLLDLGQRYEAGDGVPADMVRAEALYASAATTRLGTLFIYVPGVGKARGYVTPITTGPDIPGLPAGDYKRGLMHIEGRAARSSYRRGLKLIERAAKAGFAPAAETLATIGRIKA